MFARIVRVNNSRECETALIVSSPDTLVNWTDGRISLAIDIFLLNLTLIRLTGMVLQNINTLLGHYLARTITFCVMLQCLNCLHEHFGLFADFFCSDQFLLGFTITMVKTIVFVIIIILILFSLQTKFIAETRNLYRYGPQVDLRTLTQFQ